MYDVSVKQAPEQVYVSRTEEDLPQERVEEFVISTLRELAGEHEPSSWPFAVYHGLDPDADGDGEGIGPVEVCLPTRDGDRVLAAAKVAFTVAHGNDRCRYPQIVAAYDAIWSWAKEHGRELAGPPREIYRFRAGEERVFEIAWPLR